MRIHIERKALVAACVLLLAGELFAIGQANAANRYVPAAMTVYPGALTIAISPNTITFAPAVPLSTSDLTRSTASSAGAGQFGSSSAVIDATGSDPLVGVIVVEYVQASGNIGANCGTAVGDWTPSTTNSGGGSPGDVTTNVFVLEVSMDNGGNWTEVPGTPGVQTAPLTGGSIGTGSADFDIQITMPTAATGGTGGVPCSIALLVTASTGE